MYKSSVAQKIISVISSLSLFFQLFAVLFTLIPVRILAAGALQSQIDFNQVTNKFTVTLNNKDVHADGPINYALFYRTDKNKNEAFKGLTDKNITDNFQKDLYAGTCSENGVCTPNFVTRGLLKMKVESQNWITAQKFSIDDGKLKLVEEYTPADLDPLNLTDAENYWLEYGSESSPTPTATSTPTLSPTPTIVESGQILDGISTANTATNEAVKQDLPVELGKEYTAPFNDKLKITFTKLPEKPGTIKMKELFVSFNVTTGEQIGSAYEITSDMADGTFLYDLTLPVPVDSQGHLEGTSESVESAGVSYSEDGKDFSSVTNEKSLDRNNRVITIKNLDHFTIFVLVANPSGITNGMLSVIGDTYIKQDGASNNFGGSDPINIYSQTTNKNRRILIKFDLSPIPVGSTVSTATLKLKMTNAPGTTRQYDVYRVTNSWDENTVTWTNQPTIAASLTSSVSSGTTNNVVLSWNVTSDVNAFLSGTANNGWLIRDNAEDSTSANTNQAGFASKENGTNSNRPQLSIDFSLATPANTAPASSGGFNSPSTQSAVTLNSGDSDGYGTNPTNAFVGDGTFATDSNSGANSNSDCSNSGTGVDRHIFNNYGLTIPAGAAVNGIEVRQDLKVSSLADSPFTCVQLSWDGGITWTSVKQKSLTSTDLTPYYFGSSTDTWGRSWSASDFSNANFRVRLANGDTDNSHSTTDFSLDWIPVRVYYTQDTTAPTLAEVTPVSTLTNDSTPNYTFNSSEAGIITYGGDCSSATTAASSGNNTITFNSLSDGTHSNCTIQVTDSAGNISTALNVSSFTIDTTSPNTTIDSAPASLTNSSDASFTFSSNESSTFECKLDSASFSSCTSPQNYTGLSEGTHTFDVRATDTAGNTDLSPAQHTWTIDKTSAVLSPVSFVSNNTNNTWAKTGDTVTLSFTANESLNSVAMTIAAHTVSATNSSGNDWSGSYTLDSSDSEGLIPFTIDVIDQAGNASSQVTSTTDGSSVTFDKTDPNTTIDSGPVSPSNSTTAAFTFSANEVGSTFECKIDGGSFTSCASPKSYSSLSEGSHSFQVRAIDPAGNVDGSPSVTGWDIDTTSPNTTIDSAPASLTNSSDASFTFSSNESSTFECKLDSASFSSCTSPQNYTGLSEGTHTFDVRATDTAGNTDLSPAQHTWTIDKTSAVLSPVSFVSNNTNNTWAKTGDTVTLSFTANESLNSVAMTIAAHTVSATNSSGNDWSGSYTLDSSDSEGLIPFTIDVIDQAGNASSQVTSTTDGSSVTFDKTDPNTTIDSGPVSPSNSTTAAFTFSANEVGSTFECKIDGGSFTSCASPKSYSSLSEGSHSFQVRAIDPAGNVDGSLSTYLWNIDIVAPTTSDSGIDSFWHNSDVTVTLSCDDGTGSGCVVTYHTVDGSTPTTSSATGNPFTLTSNGEYTIKYFSVDGAGNEEAVKTAANTVKIDKNAPVDPTVNSTSHTASTWSTDNTIDISWSGATDNLSGVAGYSYLFDTSATTLPDEISEGPGTSTSSAVLSDGNAHYFHLRTIDNASNWTSTVHKGPFYIDTTNPNTPTATPPAGDYSYHPSVTLTSSDATSGIAAIYYTTDGTTPNNTKTLYSTPILITTDTTIKAIAYDNAGNTSAILTAAYGIAPIISAQTSSTLSGTSAVITWTTDILATSRVIYDTVSHSVLGAAPNYGYASSTVEDPSKVLSHSVTVTGLSDGVTYYYRTVSHGSPEAVGDEKYLGTFSKTSGNTGDGKGDGRGGGGGGGGGVVSAVPAVAGAATAFTPATVVVPAEVLGVSSPEAELTATPSPEVLGKMKGPEVKTASKLPKILLGLSLIVLIVLVIMYIKKKRKTA